MGSIQLTVYQRSSAYIFLDGWKLIPSRRGTPFYRLYRYVSPHQVGFLRRFGLKTGMHFAHFGLESGMVFGGTMGVCERIYR